MLGRNPAKAEMKRRKLFGQSILEGADGGASAKGKKKPAAKEKIKAGPKKNSKSSLPGVAAEDAARGKWPEVLAIETQDAPIGDSS